MRTDVQRLLDLRMQTHLRTIELGCLLSKGQPEVLVREADLPLALEHVTVSGTGGWMLVRPTGNVGWGGVPEDTVIATFLAIPPADPGPFIIPGLTQEGWDVSTAIQQLVHWAEERKHDVRHTR